MFSRLGDDVVIRILALGSTWPHFFVRLACIRFNRLSSAFTAAATNETLVVASREGVWLLNQERGCWAACAPLPAKVECVEKGGALCDGEAMFIVRVAGPDCIFAFNPKLNTWREVPKPPNMKDLFRISALGDEQVRTCLP